jgi:hypothetical protein
MSDLGDAAARIGDKVSELLDVFDLSFFMSGALCMGAILFMLPESVPNPLWDKEIPGTAVFGLVLGSYVLGLFCFAIGRPLRRPSEWLRKLVKVKLLRRENHIESDDDRMRAALAAQGVEPAALARYFAYAAPNDKSPSTALYTRMWVHVRSYARLKESFSLLKRYWMLSAAYDGIAVAALVWLLPVWTKLDDYGLVYTNPWLATVGVVFVAVSCWYRAQQYKRYQIEEIVATVAHWISLMGRRELEGLGTDAADEAADEAPDET